MSDQAPPPPETDADVVLFALKNMGSATYATLAVATGLSKPAISSAITDLTKRGLVTGKSGTYSPAEAAASEPTTESEAAKSETPPPPAARKKKVEQAKKSTGSDDDDDAEVVLAALTSMGSGTYATLSTATGLSKPAVSAAITDLSRRGLVTGKSGEYSTAGAKPAAAKPKAVPSKKREPSGTQNPVATSSASLADELERLAALREAGALTAAEFTKAKKKLLDTD